MQTGYSRFLLTMIEDGQGTILFEYLFETGFEHERQSHRLLGVRAPASHARFRATFTADASIQSANDLPWRRFIQMPNLASGGAAGLRVGLAEEPAAWTDESAQAWLKRVATEPVGRTWETLPDYLVGLESAPMDAEQVGSLVASGKELAKLL
jgi:hypothetical protein